MNSLCENPSEAFWFEEMKDNDCDFGTQEVVGCTREAVMKRNGNKCYLLFIIFGLY
jgi:hypothetical protein